MSASKANATIGKITNYGNVPWIYMRNTVLESAIFPKVLNSF